MDLNTAKLVVFALYAETYEGVMSKPPGTLSAMWAALQALHKDRPIVDYLEADLKARFLNYTRIWGGVENGLKEEKHDPGVEGVPGSPGPGVEGVPGSPGPGGEGVPGSHSPGGEAEIRTPEQ